MCTTLPAHPLRIHPRPRVSAHALPQHATPVTWGLGVDVNAGTPDASFWFTSGVVSCCVSVDDVTVCADVTRLVCTLLGGAEAAGF